MGQCSRAVGGGQYAGAHWEESCRSPVLVETLKNVVVCCIAAAAAAIAIRPTAAMCCFFACRPAEDRKGVKDALVEMTKTSRAAVRPKSS